MHFFTYFIIQSWIVNASQHCIDINYSWIFLHYHKTGHDLANHFAKPFKRLGCSSCVVTIRRVDIFNSKKIQNNTHIVIARGINLNYPWVDTFSAHNLSNVHVVHFVRDPFDMVLSGFLYHSQIPIPSAERWLNYPNHDVCGHNKTFIMNVVVPKLAESISGHNISHNVHELRHNFTLLHQKCEKLQLKYNHMSYSDMLQSAKNSRVVSDGIFLEMMRVTFMLDDQKGDLLRMAMNTMYEDKRMSKRVFTSQFPIGDKATFLKTTAEIFDFLMPDSDHNLTTADSQPFWHGYVTKEIAVKAVESSAFIPAVPKTNTTSDNNSGCGIYLKQHVTAGFVNSTTRANYMSMLASDPEIAPILNLVRNILLTVHN